MNVKTDNGRMFSWLMRLC